MYVMNLSQFNISVQTSSPRWVYGRTLATFQATVTGGIAVGSWTWGIVAQHFTVSTALAASGLVLVFWPLATRFLRIPRRLDLVDTTPIAPDDPEVKLALTHRSGPILVEIEYEIDPHQARDFYVIMQKVRRGRQRTGAYEWALLRDIGIERLWVERYKCPTWLDYLHQRSRSTQIERHWTRAAMSLHNGSVPVQVRRIVEQPAGVSRWRDSTPANGAAEVAPLP
jgi:hypothetical protein